MGVDGNGAKIGRKQQMDADEMTDADGCGTDADRVDGREQNEGRGECLGVRQRTAPKSGGSSRWTRMK